VVTLIGSLTMSFLGRFAAARTLLLGVACVAMGRAAVLLGIAVAEVAIGDATGVSIAVLIRAGNCLFLGVGRGFGARISGPSLMREVTAVFYSLVA